MYYTRFSLGLENLEKWEGASQPGKIQGILNRLEKLENFVNPEKCEPCYTLKSKSSIETAIFS